MTLAYRSILLLVLLSALLLPATSFAEYLCKGEVGYSWLRMNKEGEVSDKEMEVFWAAREVKGEDEKGTKSKLEEVLLREKGFARQACKKEHENLSGCIAGKFQAMKAIMKLLDFSSRKAIEDSVKQDCQAQLGICKMVTASEILCENLEVEDEKGKKKEDKEEEKPS